MSIAPVAVAQTRLTFQDALHRAVTVNNSVERAHADVSAANELRKSYLSAVLPQVNLQGAVIRNSQQVSFGSGSDTRLILPGSDWNYRFVLSQPVFAGLREQRAYNQAKLGVSNAEQSVFGTEDAVLLRVASNYLAVVAADAQIEVEKQNIGLAQKRLDQASAFFKAGEVTRVDVLRAETAIRSEQRLLASEQQAREEAVSRLRADLDLPPGPVDVVRPESPFPALPDEPTLVARALDRRPDVVQAANNVRVAHLEVQKQKGFWAPVVTFDAGYINQKSAFPSSSYGYGALRFTVPIWDSFETKEHVAIARDQELQAGLYLEDAKTAAREDVHTAMSGLQEAETSMQLANDQLNAAQAEYQQNFELYRAQETTSLDLAASEASLADARRAVVAETLNRAIAQLRVWYAAGALKDALGVTRS